MKLPNSANAVIASEKLRDYLLSPTHPVGRFKAPFFNALGYSQDRWEKLEEDLRLQHLSLDALPGQRNEYGQKYEIHGPMTGPNGKSANLVSVWIILNGATRPRFITAYPGEQT